MTYQDTLDYMFTSLPMYHLVGKEAYKADLLNTIQLMEHLGQPHRSLRCIHVAGTNGKGSVSNFLAAILHRAGYKVGLFTSPHLIDFRERIRINGTMIPQQAVTDFIALHRSFLDAHHLSFFEMTTGLAFDYFVRQQVDIAVIEVGMGGRLDSTNVVTPILSIITNIGLDHTQFLGDTLSAIAAEKGGIIKPRVPVVVGESHADTDPVFQRLADAAQSPIFFADKLLASDPEVDRLYALSQSQGAYQRKNITTLLQAIHLFPRLGLHVTPDAVSQGVTHMMDDTGFAGRWHILAHRPLVVAETAHNPHGINAMLLKLDQCSFRQLHIVYGCVSDKDFSSVIALLPPYAHYYFTQPSVPRRLPAQQLANHACQHGLCGDVFPLPADALNAARAAAGPDDMILVTGSIFLVADILPLFTC